MVLPPVFVVQAITAQVGPAPSTRGPSVIFRACALCGSLGAAVAETAKAAANAIVVINFILQYPFFEPAFDSDLMLAVRCVHGRIRFSAHLPPGKPPLLAT